MVAGRVTVTISTCRPFPVTVCLCFPASTPERPKSPSWGPGRVCGAPGPAEGAAPRGSAALNGEACACAFEELLRCKSNAEVDRLASTRQLEIKS